ncbi:hypothetical protein BJ741DRAFT_676479 [Chytriomyces cf. hyalinus JEL632]|nr:hypothetical protein BJ741DRAFT_676479 [Chytriomyces cf. hyalinus JEL632]
MTISGSHADVQPKRDLTRFVKMAQSMSVFNAKKTILCQRLKFSKTLDKKTDFFPPRRSKYRPKKKVEKKARLTVAAEAKASGAKIDARKKPVVKYGINHITALIEAKRAQLVLIALDVGPIELVVWLPVPVKGKSRLGVVVHKKTAAALAITDVGAANKYELAALISAVKTNLSEKV